MVKEFDEETLKEIENNEDKTIFHVRLQRYYENEVGIVFLDGPLAGETKTIEWLD